MARHRERRLAGIAACASLLIAWTTHAWASPRSPDGLADRLPAPFAGWNVAVTASDEGPGVHLLAYDSPALHRRTINTVYLPGTYTRRGSPFPVLYYLHGTVLPFIDAAALDPLTCTESFVCMVSGGGGYKQAQLQDFASQQDRATFLVVAPDTDPAGSWCDTCWWIDGRADGLPNSPPLTAETVPAETVLYAEILPLVEALYNVRQDRGGRGVIGFSMGGAAAALQGFRHPDRFAYTGSISGIYDIVGDLVVRNGLDGAGYFRDQGYPYLTSRAWWRNFNPADLADNLVGSGMALMFSGGDMCLPPTDAEGQQDCARYPSLRNPVAALVENILSTNSDRSIKALPEHGLVAEEPRFSGVHGANNHRVYAEVIVPQANAVFASAPATEATFRYRAVDRRFTIWDYRFTVDRDADEFLEIDAARHDGRALDLRGSGLVTVRTPATFRSGDRYAVIVSSATARVARTIVTATPGGRLVFSVDLDAAALGQTRATGHAHVVIRPL